MQVYASAVDILDIGKIVNVTVKSALTSKLVKRVQRSARYVLARSKQEFPIPIQESTMLGARTSIRLCAYCKIQVLAWNRKGEPTEEAIVLVREASPLCVHLSRLKLALVTCRRCVPVTFAALSATLQPDSRLLTHKKAPPS